MSPRATALLNLGLSPLWGVVTIQLGQGVESKQSSIEGILHYEEDSPRSLPSYSGKGVKGEGHLSNACNCRHDALTLSRPSVLWSTYIQTASASFA